MCGSRPGNRKTGKGLKVIAETINSDSLAAMDWDDSYFKFCNFTDFYVEGGLVASDFNWCSFARTEWYWGLFSGCNLIHCTFVDCTFARTSFADSRLVECTFLNCTFKKDNLGGGCNLSETTF